MVNRDNSITVANKSDQQYNVTSKTFYPPQTFTGTTLQSTGSPAPLVRIESNEVASTDDQFYDSGGNYIGHSGQAAQNYFTQDSSGYCYSRTLSASNLVFTSDTSGSGCPAPGNQQ